MNIKNTVMVTKMEKIEGIHLEFVINRYIPQASQVASVIKNLPADAGDIRDVSSIPELRRSPGGGNGNPLQSSCLKNPMDRGAWQSSVQKIAKN